MVVLPVRSAFLSSLIALADRMEIGASETLERLTESSRQ